MLNFVNYTGLYFHHIAFFLIKHYFVGDFGDTSGDAVNNIYRFPEPDDIFHDQTLVISSADKLEFRFGYRTIVTTRSSTNNLILSNRPDRV